ncbi:hypothetical protein HPB50_008239 [Hyalomma asiaticum]|uniref:Uncharacterized protein n=1 Tax=Hyalomma asiaticum TaxID=266040 RepID=A0ACB7T8H5_HYAAI|nr:hypothetical protein HPB50_008239 [Hyalomma asiaticum]
MEAARKDRLTASNFGVAVSREKWTEKGLQNLTTDRDLSRVRAIQYGVSSEAVAVQKYETTLRTIRHNIQTFHCGLVVDPGCPWLGASPDRVVWDPEEQEPHGIVEIKCPYSMKDLKEPCIQGSCLIKDNNGTYRLNRTHCYYYQPDRMWIEVAVGTTAAGELYIKSYKTEDEQQVELQESATSPSLLQLSQERRMSLRRTSLAEDAACVPVPHPSRSPAGAAADVCGGA